MQRAVTIAMANSLQLAVVADGAKSFAQSPVRQENHRDRGQGFALRRRLPPDGTRRLLELAAE